MPRQLVGVPGLSRLFDRLGREAIGFDDFRRNGLLLPASEKAARILGLPLHRGPHRHYNRMVIDRVGLIERGWAGERRRDDEAALGTVAFRLRLLQNALRRRLLQPGPRRVVLNGRDPALADSAFAELDAMADLLWTEAEAVDPGGW
ncbi:AHH domain-containing protein [Novosphingobium bradum]|uniref:AHH domain-containing protein n=1 Tax=Novosphingobium bradum TaxID=1737444 RepID=A0ABV7IQB5_9SPHN